MNVATTWQGPIAIIYVEGPVDADSSQILANELAAVTARRPSGVVVDLGEVPALSLAGVATFTKAARELRQLGSELALAAPEPPVARILRQEKVREAMTVEPTVCLAVTDLQLRREAAMVR